MIKTPEKWYIVFVDLGQLGIGALTDGPIGRSDMIDVIVDECSDRMSLVRVFCVEMDVDTNQPEAITDATNPAIAEARSRLTDIEEDAA